MPDEGLLETPETEDVDLGAESTEGAEESTAEGTETQTETQTQTRDDSAPVISDANGQLKLSETARAELDKIKAENPRLAREIRAALFDRKALLTKVPGGVKEALATIEAYEAEGGSEAVQQVKQELGQWKGLDADFKAGNPAFVNDIAEGNPEAFTKIGPVVMAKLAEIAPEVFSHEISKVFAQDMLQAEVPFALKLFRREIEDPQNPGKTKPGMEGIAEVYNSLQAYADRVTSLAKAAPKSEAKTTTANRTGNPDLDQREQALAEKEFLAEERSARDSFEHSEFAKNAGNRKFSEEKLSTISELYDLALKKMLPAIPGHISRMQKFRTAGDKAGYRKELKSALKSKAPEAMAAAFRKAGVGAKLTAAKPAAKPAAGAAKAPTTAATGFVRSAIKPSHNEVNWPATNAIAGKKAGDGKFIMRDGSRVLYSR
jgi:hypothetical protein